MQRLLTRVYKKGVRKSDKYQIWEKKTLDGDSFWGIGNFCGLPTENVSCYGKELTDLEWRGNEIFLSDSNQEQLEEHAVAVYLSLKEQMENGFSDIIFDLMVSVDEKACTANIRFWAVRDNYHYVEPTHQNLSGFQQEAVLIDTVNAIHLEKYMDLLPERFKHHTLNICCHQENKEAEIQNPAGENIYITWNEEFTMYFSAYHGHYCEQEWEELLRDVEKIIAGEYVAARIESAGRWLGSRLCEPEEIPVTSKSRLLKFLLGNKYFYEEIRKNGAVLTITGWNPEDDKRYLISDQGVVQTEERQRDDES